MIKDSNYVVILAPMITNLKLKGNELLIFAIIHGFTQDGESEYTGGTKYLQEWTNIDKSTVLAVLKRLTEKGFVTKKEQFFNNVKFCNYSSNYEDLLKATPGRKIQPPPVGKSNHPRSENPTTPGRKIQPNITIDNTINNSNSKKPANDAGELFPDTNPNKKTLFRNSIYATFETFEKQFREPEFANVDLAYYFHSVADWSDSANKQRTARGWLATARNFMRGDADKKRLRLKQTPQQNSQEAKEAMDYLKGFE